jgi:hypothetical protein
MSIEKTLKPPPHEPLYAKAIIAAAAASREDQPLQRFSG